MPRPAGHALNRDAWDDLTRLTGATITGVAELAPCNHSTLSGLVAGRHRASNDLAVRIAGAVGCRPGTLFPTLAAPTPASLGRPQPDHEPAEAQAS